MLRADLDHCEWLPDDLKTGEMIFIPGGTFRMCWYYTDPSRTQGFWDYCP